MKCRSAGYDCCCCLSWCACRAVVGVIVPQAIVLCDGIPRYKLLVVLGRNNPSLYTVNGRPLYVHLNGLAIVLLK
jgi:hypothetical protein